MLRSQSSSRSRPNPGLPVDLVRHVHEGPAQFVHRDEPFVDEPEHQFRVAAPAHRIAVRVVLDLVEDAFRLKRVEDVVVYFRDRSTGQRAESLDVDTRLVEGRDRRQIMFLAKREVFRTRARRDMDDSRALVLADVVPLEYPVSVLGLGLGGQFVERASIAPSDQFAAGYLGQHLAFAIEDAQRAGAEPQDVVTVAYLCVGVVGVDCGGYVCGERPRRGCPDEQGLARAVQQRQFHVKAGVGDFPVALRDDLVLREAGTAAGAPRHGVGGLVEPAALVAHLQEVPDGVVILVRHGVVRVVPVHEICEALGLFGLHAGKLAHPSLAVLYELADAVRLDVALGRESLLLFDLHLDPQPLSVEPVLESLAVALHVPEAEEQVLVRASPCVVDAHGVVGRDRSVDERKGLVRRLVAAQVAVDDARLVPPLEQSLFHRHEIGLR